MIASTVISLVVYITAVLGSPNVEKRDALSDQVVTLHNQYRAQYGAQAVTWSQSRYSAALAHGQNCVFEHSDTQGQFGENLYAASPSGTIGDALSDWMGEESQYDYNNPGFSEATGHFTQVVWKGTTQVGCAIADCPPDTIFPGVSSQFVVCQYTPPGNVEGEFAQNVGEPISS